MEKGEKGETVDSYAGLGTRFIDVILMGWFVNHVIAALVFHWNGNFNGYTEFIHYSYNFLVCLCGFV